MGTGPAQKCRAFRLGGRFPRLILLRGGGVPIVILARELSIVLGAFYGLRPVIVTLSEEVGQVTAVLPGGDHKALQRSSAACRAISCRGW